MARPRERPAALVVVLAACMAAPCATFTTTLTPARPGVVVDHRRASTSRGGGLRLAASKGRDDDVEDPDEAARIAAFRARLMSGGLDAVAKADTPEPETWARRAAKPGVGRVLLGEEAFFFGTSDLATKALARVGLPADVRDRIGPEFADRRKALLPAVLLLDVADGDASMTSGVLLGRRSGFILGDFKELDFGQFLIQPLWVGGPSAPPPGAALARRTVGRTSKQPRSQRYSGDAGDAAEQRRQRKSRGGDDSASSTSRRAEPTGILAVHPYSSDLVPDAVRLTDDGLYCGGDWETCQDLVERGRANPFRFRLYAQATTWDDPSDLQRELDAGAWRIADVSTELLLKDRERGAQVWTDIDAELAKTDAAAGAAES